MCLRPSDCRMRHSMSSEIRGRSIVAIAVTLAIAAAPWATHAAPPAIVDFSATVAQRNRITLHWQVEGATASNLLYIYDSVGFRPVACPDRQPAGCSTSFRVDRGGTHRYTLSVRNDAMEYANRSIDVQISVLSAPAAPARIDVDVLDPQPQTFSWSRSGSGFVRLLLPGSAFPPAVEYPATGSYTVPATDLPVGRHTYELQYCERFAPNELPLCSPARGMTFVVGPARFAGAYRRFVPAHQPVSLSWSGSGSFWHLSAPSLGIQGVWLTHPSYTVPGQRVIAGLHRIELVSCASGPGGDICSNRADITAPVAGTVAFAWPDGTSVTADQSVATLAPDAGGDPVELRAARVGTFHRQVADGAHVGASDLVASVITADVDRKEIVAGARPSVPTWSYRPWSADFTAASYGTWQRPDTGDPLDVAFDPAGGVWQVGEFGTAVAHLEDGVLTHHSVPYARTWDSGTGLYERVKPYRICLFGGCGPTAISVLGERIIARGNAVWFTQGGDLLHESAGNHSRLIRFDRLASDDPATPDDDRLCAVHVPGDRNEVIGIAADGDRIWFAESRFFGGPAGLGWFVDDGQVRCDNTLDYQDQAAVDAAAARTLCTEPDQQGCIHRVPLPAAAGRAAHLAIDAAGGWIWFTDYSGSVLGRYPLAGGAVETFPLPAPLDSDAPFKSFPWQIRVTADAVYLAEYGDRQLVRFDKTIPDPTAACAVLLDGANPCMTELFLPMAGDEVNLHSVALHGDRLWFTLANEASGPSAPGGSTFGYVNLGDWAADTPTGVLYNGLDTLGTRRPGDHHSFRGIEVSALGRIGLVDMHYDELVVLQPR